MSPSNGPDHAMITFEATVARKHPSLQGYVVVPAAQVAPWQLTGTTTVEGTITGPSGTAPLGRRSLKRWDDDRWFVELTAKHLAATGLAVGGTASLSLSLASDALPPELEAWLTDPDARRAWDGLTAPQRRMAREELWLIKSADARQRWIDKRFAPAPERSVRVPGRVRVRVHGTQLPGRTWGEVTDIAVVMQVGTDCVGPVPGDAAEAWWEADVELGADGRLRGPAVNGPTGGRFLYLGWLGSLRGAPMAMFRRLKIGVDAIPDSVWAAAVAAGEITAEVVLSDARGPACASWRGGEWFVGKAEAG